MKTKPTIPYAELLKEAVNKEGVLSDCYSRFHNFSIGNQLWAWLQAKEKKLELGAIATMKQWNELGRKVKKGSEAIYLTMPLTLNRKDSNGKKTEETYRIFVPKKNWFLLSQTEGDDYTPQTKIAEWDKDKALAELKIEEIDYDMADGNCQGYAVARKVAINSIAVLPHKTLFHEIAHVVLGHTLEHTMADSEITPRDIREVEAESVAYILCSVLGLKGLVESRGYIQSWLKDQTIDDKTAQRIFSTANKILNAGKESQNA